MFKNRLTLLLVPIVSTLTLHAADPLVNDPFGDDIFKEMYQMQKEMDKVFERMHQRMQQRTQQLNQPNIQFYTPSSLSSNAMFEDKGDHYEYDTGIKANQNNEINLAVNDRILTFKAKVTDTKIGKEQGMRTQQHYTSVMQRSQTLPDDADADSVKMEAKNGDIVVMVRKKMPSHTLEKNAAVSNKVQPPHVKEKEEKTDTVKKVSHTETKA